MIPGRNPFGGINHDLSMRPSKHSIPGCIIIPPGCAAPVSRSCSCSSISRVCPRVPRARGVQLRIRVALNRHKYIMLAAPACTGGWETRSIGISLWVEVGLPGMGRGVNWFPSVHIHTNKHSQCVPTRTHCVCVYPFTSLFICKPSQHTHTEHRAVTIKSA